MFRIGRCFYNVHLIGELPKLEESTAIGLCCNTSQRIVLWHGLHPDQRMQTLIHELTHAWVYQAGLPDNEENHCNMAGMATASALYDLQNSQDTKLISWLGFPIPPGLKDAG